MVTLLLIGFLGGVVTGISPCIIPVVPVIVASGASEVDRRRPFVIIGGLVVSFTTFTLVGGQLLSALHLPQDLLRTVAIVMLIVLAFGLLLPPVGELLERPFARLGSHRQVTSLGGFVLGASLGLIFVPCAGPVLAAISVVAATHRVGLGAWALTLSYAVGAALPLLVLAVLAQRAVEGFARLRAALPTIRKITGGVLLATAVVVVGNVAAPLQRSTPGFTGRLQDSIGASGGGAAALRSLTGERTLRFSGEVASAPLANQGPAPAFTGITSWLNTPAGRPLTLASLRGHVVLVDFWTYSCINCQRTLPHLEAWDRLYRSKGLVIVGIHAPEFPFEHVRGNVAAAVRSDGVTYPVALDNNFATWNAYANQYWPAEYLIDQEGNVRHTSTGEGEYAQTEAAIRTLLKAGGTAGLPRASGLPDQTPIESMTQESYLGYSRLNNAVGSPVIPDRTATYVTPASIPPDSLAFGGRWLISSEAAQSRADGSTITLNFTARDVYLVLSGQGSIDVNFDGQPVKAVRVAGVPNLYRLFRSPSTVSGQLHLRFPRGVSAYDFTFG
jgi:cytochrome c biogenesis protein CcdA/thiol-disulfide isomerase/thioredoxin